MAPDPTTPPATGRPTTASSISQGSGALCAECGGRLSNGACPSCALDFLLSGSSHSSDGDEPPPGHRVEENVEFGRYTLKERLAAGGMGVVYVAEDRKLKRTVALKMIRGSTFADDGEIARFTLEAEAAAALDHPHIIPIYEVGRLDGQPFFTMKLIEGGTLAKKMKDHGGLLPPREVASLMAKIARAVQHAHQRGVLHRDLKPGNILIDETGTPWLTDFGLAKVVNTDSCLTLTKDHIGTPHYMAPEVAGGNARAVSTASDVWALGVILWELLCGVPPFHGPGPVEIMRRIVDSEPNWPAGSRADSDLVTVARRCMEKNPARRPASAGEVAEELERWLRGEPIKARAVTRRERFMKWIRREPAMAALYAVLTSALFVGLTLWNRAERAVVSLQETNARMDESLRMATAIRLAADARLQVPENPSRAILLALESTEMTPSTGILPETKAALTDVLQRTGGLDATAGGLRAEYNEAWVNPNPDHQTGSGISPDSRWLMTLDFDPVDGHRGAIAAIYDLRDRVGDAPLRRWRMLEALSVAPGTIRWKWLEDSRGIVVFHTGGSIVRLDAVTPAMEAGKKEPAAPALHDWGSVALDGWELRTGQFLQGSAGTPQLLACTYREKDAVDNEPAKFRYQRWKISPDAAPEALGNPYTTGAAPPAGFVPLGDGRTAVLQLPHQKTPAYIFDTENPALAPVKLSGPDQFYSVWANKEGTRLIVRPYANQLWMFDLPAPGTASDECAGQRLSWAGGAVETVSFSPDGRWLAAVGGTPEATVFDLESNVPPRKLPCGSRCLSIAFSSDSRWLAVGTLLRNVCLWETSPASTRQPVTLAGSPSFIAAVNFSRDTRTVVAVGTGWAVRRWSFDGTSGSALPLHLNTSSTAVLDIAVSPDGEWIAACGRTDPPVAEANGSTSVMLARADGSASGLLSLEEKATCAVAFSSNGKWVVSTGHDNTVKVWDLRKATEHIAGGSPGFPAPAFVLPVDARAMRRYSVAFHPGDNCLYQVNSDGSLYAWDLSFDDPHAGHQEETIHSIAYLLPDISTSPDGRWLAVARHGWDGKKEGSLQYGNQVLLFDVSKFSWPPSFVAALPAEFIEDTNVCFSADSRWLAAGSEGRGPTIWDLTAQDIAASRRSAPISAQRTAAVGFSPDGRCLAYGGNDGRLHFWNWQNPGDSFLIQTGQPIQTLAWFPDGRIATAGNGTQIAIWDTDMQRLKELARRVAGRELSNEERQRFRIQ